MRGLVLRAEGLDEVCVERVPVREQVATGAKLGAKDAVGVERCATAFQVG